MAQISFLQKNFDEALGMIYSLLARNDEAEEQFEKYRELLPKKFEVIGT